MRTFLTGLVTLCVILLWMLGAGIHLLTLYVAYLTSFPALLATMFFPLLSQLYWIWQIWAVTGVFFNPLTLLCIAWLTLAVLTAGFAVAGER